MTSDSNRTSIIFTGSSSGGHLLPGLAVAQEMNGIRPDGDICFVTAGRKIEDPIFQPYPDFQRRTLEVPLMKMLMKNPFRLASQVKKLLDQSQQLIREIKPAAVVGLGGVQAVPLVRAAHMNHVPVVLMEQNVIPGKATQFATRYATRICLSFEETRKYFSRNSRCVFTGNPIRQELVEQFQNLGNERSDSNSNTLLISGGSQGATAVNEAVMSMVQSNRESFKGWKIIHQTGNTQVEKVRDRYQQLGITAKVSAYFEDMAGLYQQASIVICRAGATTLAELATAGKSVIAVPYPNSSRDHQLLNAKWYAVRNAARVVEQTTTEETSGKIWSEFQRLMTDPSMQEQLACNMRQFGQPEAAIRVRDEILKLI